jgi:hypothetical protein
LWGVIASLIAGVRSLAVVIDPRIATVVTIAFYGGPIALFEPTMGVWLLVKDLRGSQGSTAR